MQHSRRNVLKMGAALAAVPLLRELPGGPGGDKVFLTGSWELDRALGGGIRMGSVVAVVGPRCSGKSAFFLRLAKANGILDSHAMSTGTSDMLSIMEREDGKHIGSLMLDAAEPATDKERADMARDPAARQAFLTRWLERSREVVHDSGGLFAISVCETVDDASTAAWLDIADYVIAVNPTRCIRVPV